MSTATTLSKENNTLGLGLFNSQKTPQPFTVCFNIYWSSDLKREGIFRARKPEVFEKTWFFDV